MPELEQMLNGHARAALVVCQNNIRLGAAHASVDDD